MDLFLQTFGPSGLSPLEIVGILGVFAILALLFTVAALLLFFLRRAAQRPSPGVLKSVNLELERQVREREAMVHVLRQSEEKFRDLYNRTPVPLSSQDVQGRIIDASDYLLSLLEYERSEMVGRPGSYFMTIDSAERMASEIWPRIMALGEVRDVDIQCRSKSGRIYEMLLSSRVERRADGTFDRVYSMLLDVTARRQAELALAREIEERQRMKEMLHQSQKMEAVGQLTGGIAHDFNNLLTAINGNLDLLSMRTSGNEQVARLIESSERAVQRGASLTKQLLSFSRRQLLRPETVTLEKRFEAMQTLLSGSLRSDIQFDLRFSNDLWAVTVDPGEFDLAVINICVNARDAMPKGGILRVEASNATLEPNGIQDLAGDYVRLAISDTGVGIAPEYLARVFEPFFTTKELGKGTGLGLSQVYGFARQASGVATIESGKGEGTTVTLYLPRTVRPVMASQAPQPDAATSNITLSGELLLVEDDDDVAASAGDLLGDIGFTVRRASTPQEALDILRGPGGMFNLIFSDIVMPGRMDGIDLARQVHRLYPQIPIVLTTGHSQAAAAAGSEFLILAKPYSRDQLVAAFSSVR